MSVELLLELLGLLGWKELDRRGVALQMARFLLLRRRSYAVAASRNRNLLRLAALIVNSRGSKRLTSSFWD